jgi:hypothetical protein
MRVADIGDKIQKDNYELETKSSNAESDKCFTGTIIL